MRRDRAERTLVLMIFAVLAAFLLPWGNASAASSRSASSTVPDAGTQAAAPLPGLIAGHESFRGVYTVEPGKPATLRYLGMEGIPAWSPDGLQLAVIQGDGTGLTAQIVIVDRDGNELDQAVAGVRNLFALDWSPDGTRMAYSCLTEDRLWTEVCLVDLTTGETEMLTDPTDKIGLNEPRSRISWSPDGNLIAYGAGERYDCPGGGDCRRSVIALVDPAVGETSIYPTGSNSYDPDFSPDGREIAYSNYPDGVMVGPAPGFPGAARQVVSLEHSGDHDSEDPSRIISALSHPTWSPDGGAIAFLSDTDGAVQENADVFIVDAQGGPIANTTSSDNTDDYITWAQPVPGCTIEGTPKPDKLVGTSAGDIICGAGGNDVIKGKGGDDRLVGGGGDDRLIGQGGKDILLGQEGADTLVGGGQKDRFSGDAGKDTLLARDGVGNEKVDGGGGRDDCRADPKDDLSRCE